VLPSWNLTTIESAFVEAAIDRSKWVAAMDAVAATTGSAGAILLPVPSRAVPVVPFSESLGTTSETYFNDGWVDRDVRYRGIPTLLRNGVVCDLDFVTKDEIKRSAYYHDFLGRDGLRWFAGVKVAVGNDVWCLSIQRSTKQGPFERAELEKLASLSMSLSSAASVAHALDFARAEGALNAFEVSNLPVVLLNRQVEVLQTNAAADLLLSGDVAIRQRRVTSHDPEANRALNAALQAVLSSSASRVLMPPVSLPRSLGRPLLAYAMRLPALSDHPLALCQAILLFVDLDRETAPADGAVLRRCFGLSAAEARLAAGLANGKTLDHLAEELAITKETARHELKLVFSKLDVHRQSELVALLGKLLRTATNDAR
jgi:DNA-binding CsgD family transcriptional regulator